MDTHWKNTKFKQHSMQLVCMAMWNFFRDYYCGSGNNHVQRVKIWFISFLTCVLYQCRKYCESVVNWSSMVGTFFYYYYILRQDLHWFNHHFYCKCFWVSKGLLYILFGGTGYLQIAYLFNFREFYIYMKIHKYFHCTLCMIVFFCCSNMPKTNVL